MTESGAGAAITSAKQTCRWKFANRDEIVECNSAHSRGLPKFYSFAYDSTPATRRSRVDAKPNQYVQPVPAGTIVNELKLTSMKNSILALATKDPVREKVAKRLRPENFGQKPTEVRKKPPIRSKELQMASFA
jgi:hypothetical protein